MPDYSDIDINRYFPTPATFRKHPYSTIMVSRACPYMCTFCDRAVFGSKITYRPFEHIVEEIEFLRSEYKIKELRFFDDTFTLNKELVIKSVTILPKRILSGLV